jgi:hypothetical protein
MNKKKQKIALVLYGFLRHFEEARESSASFFESDQYDVDVFLYSPKYRNDPQAVSANTAEIVTNEMLNNVYGKSLKKAVLWDYTLDKFVEKAQCEDLPLFNKRLVPCERYYSLFFHMQNAMKLLQYEILAGVEYEQVFISRPDIVMKNFVGIESNVLKANDGVVTLPKRPVVYHDVRFDDRFFAIAPKQFIKIVDIYDNLDKYIKEQKLLFIPEDITCHHVKNKGISISNHMLVSLQTLLLHKYRAKHRYEHKTGRKISTLQQTTKQQEELIRAAFVNYDAEEMNIEEQQSTMNRLVSDLYKSVNF